MITFDSFGQNTASGTGAGVSTFTFNNVAGNFMFASIMLDSLSVDVAGSSIFYNGQALTQLYYNKISTGALWVGYLSSPSIGSYNFASNFTSTPPDTFRIGVSTFSGVDTTTPLGGNNNTTDSTNSTPISTTVTVSGASGVVVDAFYGLRVISGNAQSPQTSLMNNTGPWTSSGVDNLGGMSYVAHTGSNVTMTWENLTFNAGTPRKLLYATELLPAPPPTFIPQLIVM